MLIKKVSKLIKKSINSLNINGNSTVIEFQMKYSFYYL